ncbi:MAG TPA: hypothetical protein VKH42_08460 [Vicinamibacterales bacterium]|nr:hypothetical protein [Vicinamibacterales bacterium]
MKSIGPVFMLATLMTAGSAGAQQTSVAQAPVAATPRIATPAPEMKGQPMPQGFSVVLVLGDLTGGSNADASVPAAARKALNDMKDFLPYKGYRLLDGSWVIGSRSTTRMRGPEGQDYELTLEGSAHAGGKVHVMFRLRDGTGEPAAEVTAATTHIGERAALEQRARELEREIIATRERLGERSPEVLNRQTLLAEMKKRIDSDGPMTAAVGFARARPVIDTSFDMEIGETVVVGTSRLKDTGKDNGRALIALLTAVPKNGPPPKQE